MQEGAPEPFGADLTDPSPAQGKPWCITSILMITEYIYICDVHLSYRHFMETTCINISTYESYWYKSSSCYAQDIGSVGNLPLLTICEKL